MARNILLAQMHNIRITVLHNNRPCQDMRKSSFYSLSVPTLIVSTKLLLQNYLIFECFVNSIIYFQKFQQYLYITKLSVICCHALKKVLKADKFKL